MNRKLFEHKMILKFLCINAINSYGTGGNIFQIVKNICGRNDNKATTDVRSVTRRRLDCSL